MSDNPQVFTETALNFLIGACTVVLLASFLMSYGISYQTNKANELSTLIKSIQSAETSEVRETFARALFLYSIDNSGASEAVRNALMIKESYESIEKTQPILRTNNSVK